MSISIKSFLSRASVPITADALSSLKKDSCPDDILKVVTNLSRHCEISHAQCEEPFEGAATVQLNLKPKSDSNVGYGEKVFSVPEMVELGEALKSLSKLKDVEVETYIDSNTLVVEIYRAA